MNGLEVRGRSVNDVCDMLAGMTGTLAFIIIPAGSQQPPTHAHAHANTIHVKVRRPLTPTPTQYTSM